VAEPLNPGDMPGAVPAVFVGKDGKMKNLIVKRQGKTGQVFGFEPDVRSQPHGRATFHIGHL